MGWSITSGGARRDLKLPRILARIPRAEVELRAVCMERHIANVSEARTKSHVCRKLDVVHGFEQSSRGHTTSAHVSDQFCFAVVTSGFLVKGDLLGQCMD